MKNRIRRAGTLLLCLLLCLSLLPAGSAEASNTRYTHGDRGEFSYEADFSRETLGDVIERYLAKKGYDEHYFAIGWVDLASGEEWYYNPDLYLFAGSTYKFPLAMLCLDKVASGELSLDQRIGSYDLERDLHDLIVDSSNIVAELLKYHLSPGDPAEVYYLPYLASRSVEIRFLQAHSPRIREIPPNGVQVIAAAVHVPFCPAAAPSGIFPLRLRRKRVFIAFGKPACLPLALGQLTAERNGVIP